MTEDDRMKIFQTNKQLQLDKVPSHTQAVESAVKLVTNASTSVCSEKSRNGYIKAKLEARKNLPSFETKAEYYKTNDNR